MTMDVETIRDLAAEMATEAAILFEKSEKLALKKDLSNYVF